MILLKKQDPQFWGTFEVTKVMSMFRGLRKNYCEYLNKTESIKLKSGQGTDDAPDTDIKPYAHAEHMRFLDVALGTFSTQPSHSNAPIDDTLSSSIISIDGDDQNEEVSSRILSINQCQSLFKSNNCYVR